MIFPVTAATSFHNKIQMESSVGEGLDAVQFLENLLTQLINYVCCFCTSYCMKDDRLRRM